MRIGIIGGTGKEGRGLGLRWARAGHELAIGSRDAVRAAEAAAELGAQAGASERVHGGDNAWAARTSEIALLAVPYGAHAATVSGLGDALEGKILVDITVPLAPSKVREVHLPPGKSAALEAQALLGPGVRVVAALHHISSVHLGDPDHAIDSDVLVCGDDDEARDVMIGLVGDLGLRGVDAGPLCNAIALEAMTPVLLYLNRRYQSKGCGLRITGI